MYSVIVRDCAVWRSPREIKKIKVIREKEIIQMAIRIGINGFGRIARVVIRAAMNCPDIDIRAINWRNADV